MFNWLKRFPTFVSAGSLGTLLSLLPETLVVLVTVGLVVTLFGTVGGLSLFFRVATEGGLDLASPGVGGMWTAAIQLR